MRLTEEYNTAKIAVSAEDKIGLPDYSHVRIFASVTRDVLDDGDDEKIKDELRKNFELVEQVLAEYREPVLALREQ